MRYRNQVLLCVAGFAAGIMLWVMTILRVIGMESY